MRGGDGLFRLTSGDPAPLDENTSARRRLPRRQQRQSGRPDGDHDLAVAPVRDADARCIAQTCARRTNDQSPPRQVLAAHDAASSEGLRVTMIRSLWIAKTGLDAQQTQLDVISNNLANVSTNGFKRSRAVFEDLLYQTLRQPGAAVVAADADSVRPDARHRRAAGRHRAHLHPGQPAADRQRARRGDQRPGLLPDPDARRHAGLHARRLLPAWTAPARSSPPAAIRCRRRSPFRRTPPSITISRDGIVSVTQPRHRDADADRHHPAGHLHQRRRPAERRREPVRRNGLVAARRRRIRRAPTAPACSTRATSKPPTSTSPRNWCSMIQTQRAYELNSKVDPDLRRDARPPDAAVMGDAMKTICATPDRRSAAGRLRAPRRRRPRCISR